jgi:hypothetical protein
MIFCFWLVSALLCSLKFRITNCLQDLNSETYFLCKICIVKTYFLRMASYENSTDNSGTFHIQIGMYQISLGFVLFWMFS